MSNLFKSVSIVSGLLVFINCYAIDSTSLSYLAFNSSLVPKVQEVVPDLSQCKEDPSPQPQHTVVSSGSGSSNSSCPQDYPLPRTVTNYEDQFVGSGTKGVKLYCCKARVQYS